MLNKWAEDTHCCLELYGSAISHSCGHTPGTQALASNTSCFVYGCRPLHIFKAGEERKAHRLSSPTWTASAGCTPNSCRAASKMTGFGFSAPTCAKHKEADSRP